MSFSSSPGPLLTRSLLEPVVSWPQSALRSLKTGSCCSAPPPQGGAVPTQLCVLAWTSRVMGASHWTAKGRNGGNNLRVCHLRQPEKLGEESVEGSLGGTVSFVLFGSETGSHCAALTGPELTHSGDQAGLRLAVIIQLLPLPTSSRIRVMCY